MSMKNGNGETLLLQTNNVVGSKSIVQQSLTITRTLDAPSGVLHKQKMQ
jgi:hypothetical protein